MKYARIAVIALCLAVIFTPSLALWLGTHIQDAKRQLPPGFMQFQPLPAKIDITPADIIDALTEYNLRHSDSVGCSQWYGVTSFELKQIDICSKYDLTQRRLTILHELVHVIYRNHGYDTGGPFEPAVDQLAHQLFQKYYMTPVAPSAE